ncbi:MAG TPA: hypothetical protein PLO55_12435 [Thermotogota bacterium]|nr:hypothetical protein [Thermotogota bacterium]
MNKSDRARALSDFLMEEGYSFKTDAEENIVLKVDGKTYFITLDEQDEMFFRIIFPNFWSIDSANERLKVEQAALKATAFTKVAKIFTVDDNIWATVEIFSSSIDNVKLVFNRSFSALKTAVDFFVQELRK